MKRYKLPINISLCFYFILLYSFVMVSKQWQQPLLLFLTIHLEHFEFRVSQVKSLKLFALEDASCSSHRVGTFEGSSLETLCYHSIL